MNQDALDALSFRSLLEAIPSPLLIIDKNFRIVAANETRQRVSGVSIQESFGRDIFEVFPDNPNDPHADGVKNLRASFHRVLLNKTADQMATQKYGVQIPGAPVGEFEERYWSPTNVPLFNAAGELTHILHRVEEVTDQVLRAKRESEFEAEINYQEALRRLMAESEANAREIANKLPMIVWTARPDGYVDWYNDWWYEYLGQPRGTGWDDERAQPMHPDDVPETLRIWQECLETGRFYTMEQRFRRGADGLYRWHIVRGVPVRNERGQIIKWIGGNTDIHDAKILAEQLKEARITAERANETKTAFLANMSHEIRTPLGAILGFSGLLKDRAIEAAEKDRYVDTIVRNGNSLTRIIDDILDLAKVEAGKLDVESVPFSLFSLTSDIIDLFKDKTKEKDIYLMLNVEESVPSHICSDPTRLRQILVNLIGNAVKFTNAGGVRVNIGCKPMSAGKVELTIDVKDTGIGIARDQQEKLFVPFTQADNSTTRKFGGTGLGLALSQRLSQAIAGGISIVEGELGKGCTFRLRLMAEVPSNAVEIATSVRTGELVPLRGMRILVVDDSADNLFLVVHLLIKNGAEVETASDGKEAFGKAVAGNYGAILMDIQMPIMDGYQAKRALDERGCITPVIALTAHAMSDEREKTRNAGFVGHLTKPLVAAELLKTVAMFAAKP